MKPMVSIICLTYNQGEYLRQAFESFLLQETAFPIEVLVHDDASTDGSEEIIKEYARRYPKVFKVDIEKENQFKKGDLEFVNKVFREARGKYIALCEGDDYWTDSSKLQRQVDFLENNPGHALVFHPVRVVFESAPREDKIFPSTKSGFTLKRLLQGNFIQTNSVMYRRQNYDKLAADVLPGDWYAHLYHAQFGKIGFIDRTMSVYRRHKGSAWDGDNSERGVFLKQVIHGHLRLARELKKMFSEDKTLRAEADMFINRLVNETIILNRKDSRFIAELVGDAPEFSSEIIVDNYDKIDELKREIDVLKARNQLLNDGVETFKAELAEIKSSKAWNHITKLRSVKARLKRTIKN